MSSIEGMDRAFIGQGTTHKRAANPLRLDEEAMLGVIEATHPFIRPMFRPLCLFAGVEALSLCFVHARYFSVVAHELRGEGGTYARS